MSLYNICKLFYKIASKFNDPSISNDEINKFLKEQINNDNNFEEILDICNNPNLNKENEAFIIENFYNNTNYYKYIDALKNNTKNVFELLDNPEKSNSFNVLNIANSILKKIVLTKKLIFPKFFENEEVLEAILIQNDKRETLFKDVDYKLLWPLIRIAITKPLTEDIIKKLVTSNYNNSALREHETFNNFIKNPSIKLYPNAFKDSNFKIKEDIANHYIDDGNFDFFFNIFKDDNEFIKYLLNSYNDKVSKDKKNIAIENLKFKLKNYILELMEAYRNNLGKINSNSFSDGRYNGKFFDVPEEYLDKANKMIVESFDVVFEKFKNNLDELITKSIGLDNLYNDRLSISDNFIREKTYIAREFNNEYLEEMKKIFYTKLNNIFVVKPGYYRRDDIGQIDFYNKNRFIDLFEIKELYVPKPLNYYSDY